MRSSIRATARCGFVMLALAGAGGCTSGTTKAPAAVSPAAAGQLQVINRSSLDMDLFLVRHGGQRSRIGLAPAGTTTTFALTPAQVAGSGTVVFQAVPTLRTGQSVTSDPVTPNQKDAITLDIPPQ